MSGQYSAEPVPHDIEQVLSEYLNRQLNLIAIALEASTQSALATTVTEVPEKLTEGAFVNLCQPAGEGHNMADNGLWGCMYNNSGKLEWKRYLPKSNTKEDKPTPN